MHVKSHVGGTRHMHTHWDAGLRHLRVNRGLAQCKAKSWRGTEKKMFAEQLLFYSRMAFHPLGFTRQILDCVIWIIWTGWIVTLALLLSSGKNGNTDSREGQVSHPRGCAGITSTGTNRPGLFKPNFRILGLELGS